MKSPPPPRRRPPVRRPAAVVHSPLRSTTLLQNRSVKTKAKRPADWPLLLLIFSLVLVTVILVITLWQFQSLKHDKRNFGETRFRRPVSNPSKKMPPIETLGQWNSASTRQRMQTASEIVRRLRSRGQLPRPLAERFRTEGEMGYLAGELVIALTEAARITEDKPEMANMSIEDVARGVLMLMAEDQLEGFDLKAY